MQSEEAGFWNGERGRERRKKFESPWSKKDEINEGMGRKQVADRSFDIKWGHNY
jgi:hypothetical protein